MALFDARKLIILKDCLPGLHMALIVCAAATHICPPKLIHYKVKHRPQLAAQWQINLAPNCRAPLNVGHVASSYGSRLEYQRSPLALPLCNATAAAVGLGSNNK